MAKITVGRVLSFVTDSVVSYLRAGSKGSTPAADVTSMVVDANHQALDVAVRINIRSLAASRVSVDGSTADTLLLASNPNRVLAIIYNDSNSPLYVGLGTDPVSLSDFSLYVSSHAMVELPVHWVGMVRGVWSTITGAARVTEMT